MDLVQLLLKSDSKFEGVMKTELKDMKTARQALLFALDTLQSKHIDFTEELPPLIQLAWSLLVQMLVRHVCKGLMQLMTPEALILHEHQIPASYIRNYLTFQKHFSLKDLVEQQLKKIAKHGKRYVTTIV